MRKVLFISLAFCALILVGQEKPKTKSDSVPIDIAKKIYVYNVARQYNDPVVARVAIYNLLAENPNNLALRDTLALMYYEQQQFASAALVAQEVTSVDPNNMFATEIAALCFEKLGVKTRALKFYQTLYLNDSDNLGHLYKIAFLQSDLKLYEEALANSGLLTKNIKSEDVKLIFPTNDGQGQEVSLKLAAIRLKGMIELSRDNKEKAKEHFNEALKNLPNFEVVIKQLESL